MFDSSHITCASHTYNLKCDVFLKYKDPALAALAGASRALVQQALDRATTDGSQSKLGSERVIRTISRQLQVEKWARHSDLRQQHRAGEQARRMADQSVN